MYVAAPETPSPRVRSLRGGLFLGFAAPCWGEGGKIAQQRLRVWPPNSFVSVFIVTVVLGGAVGNSISTFPQQPQPSVVTPSLAGDGTV